MNERKVYTREFKLHAASMVLDDNCPVPDVCASLDIGPTAYGAGSIRFARSVKVSQLKAPRRLPTISARSRS